MSFKMNHFKPILLFSFIFAVIGCSDLNLSKKADEITPIALGQPDFSTNTAPSAASASQFSPALYNYHTIHSDGSRLIVSDFLSNRVLIWNEVPSSFQQPADVVVGQPDMTSTNCNNGGTPTSATLCGPGGVLTDGNRLFVADYNNNRILIWNSIPTSNFTAADIVLGQPNFISNTLNNGGVSASSMYGPWHLTISAGKLFVSDYQNHRILIWNSIPTTNQAAAHVVVGQADMSSRISGHSSPTAATLSYPYEVASDGTKLVITDSSTNRLLIWNTIPTANGANADIVLGQPNMTTTSWPAASSQSFGFLNSVSIYNNKLYVLDGAYSRLLVWNSLPSSNNQAADAVFGQPDFVSGTVNNGGVSASSLGYYPAGLYVDSQRIIIGDPGNYRVLVLKSF